MAVSTAGGPGSPTERAVSRTVPASHDALPRLDGVSVLVVDDEPDVRHLLAMLLETTGATVEAAGSYAEALVAVRERRFDVWVCDLGMPAGDGYQLVRALRVRSAAEGGSTPAIALTGRTGGQDHTRALLAGFQAYLTKPIDARQLIENIRGLVR